MDESQQTISEIPQPPAKREPFINPANARELAAKSHEARRRAAELRAQAVEELHEPQQVDDYVARRIARVRNLIEQAEDKLCVAKDTQDCERLARSIAALSELERVLSGRPSPGAFRPREPKQVAGTGY